MKLRFYAREDALATVPGFRAGIGQAMSYIGRKYEPPGRYPATKEAHEVDTDAVSVSDHHRYLDHGRRGHVWCADAATATECNVDFVELTFKDGVWLKAPTKTLKETSK